MKQTAVEWLSDNVLSYKHPTNINGTDYILIPINKVEYLKEQAKGMEKEQNEEIYQEGYQNGHEAGMNYNKQTYGGNKWK